MSELFKHGAMLVRKDYIEKGPCAFVFKIKHAESQYIIQVTRPSRKVVVLAFNDAHDLFEERENLPGLIASLEGYKDGGTLKIIPYEGDPIYIDGRINTETPGAVYSRYPGDSESVILPRQEQLRANIIKALDVYYSWDARVGVRELFDKAENE